MKTESKTLGILGGGQLGRMSALAAAKLGINVHIYCPDNNSPASHTSSKTYNGSYTNKKLLKAFCDEVDVVTYEFENIPLETVLYIQKHKPVFPDNKLLEISQHRLTEKQFLNDIGIMTPKWSPVNSYKEIETAANDMGCSEFILKTTRFGYDGKGQVSYALGENCKDKWKQLKTNEIIIEEKLDFACEISVIIARDKLGQTALYGPILNEHKNHILYKSTYPAPIPEEMSKTARDYTLLLARDCTKNTQFWTLFNGCLHCFSV
jgi:5-(carboxyamino)imidazole ribonucleotide synthase